MGLHIRIPAALSEAGLEDNLVRRIDQQRLREPGHHWWDARTSAEQPETAHNDRGNAPEDEVAFMARRRVLRRPRSSSHRGTSSTSSSSTTTSSSSATDHRTTILFTLDRQSFAAVLPWHNSHELMVQAARTVHIQPSELLHVLSTSRLHPG